MSKTFTIETMKWTWAETVKNPAVYRDDEFVRTNTKEESLEAIEFLMGKAKGLTYTITTFREDGMYYTYFRHSMPCLGGLVKYRDSHGEKHFMNPYFPRDIRVAFPEGEIIYIGCHRANTKLIANHPFYDFVFSDDSPWKDAFGKKDTIIFKDNYFVLTNMEADPTVFYSLMRLGGLAYHGAYGIQRPGWNPKAEILLTKTTTADPRRLAGQKPIKISGGTWKEGFGYTRPYNESIFKTELPHKLEEFGKLAGYPKAPYTNKYFVDEMKSKFGVDVMSPITADNKKAHDALMEAWDYFKEESKTLSA